VGVWVVMNPPNASASAAIFFLSKRLTALGNVWLNDVDRFAVQHVLEVPPRLLLLADRDWDIQRGRDLRQAVQVGARDRFLVVEGAVALQTCVPP